MGSDVLTTIIIGVAVVAAVVILILLFKKLIKSVLALILIAVIIVGCYLGIRALDNRTNLRHKIDSVDASFEQVQNNLTSYNIKSIQCNYLGKDIGITVIYDINGESNDTLTAQLLKDTRAVLLDTERYAAIRALSSDKESPPVKIMVGLKYKGLDIRYYEAKLNQNTDYTHPDIMYDDFTLVIETGK